jgi:hypothetical protein
VTPRGDIVADPSRGLFTGNRGIIHDPATRTLLTRRWSTRSWITCALHYKNHHRAVMSPGTWTELFFLDEVTALAAGHRPCFFCRRDAARSFAAAACDGGGLSLPRAPVMDAVLHAQRLASGGIPPVIGIDDIGALPDGVAIDAGGRIHVTRGSRILPWTLRGYGHAVTAGSLRTEHVLVITPALSRAALAAGYAAHWHPSATG